MIYGAILAGGTGRRMEKYSLPKQFISIGGTPIIILTMREFLKNNRFDKIYAAINSDWMDYAEKLFKEYFSAEELEKICMVGGGKERIDSFMNIMNDIIEKNGLREEDILICHDSVRPFVSQEIIDESIDATLKYNLALTVVPVSDTIHISDDNDFICDAYSRDRLYNGQTPSGFNIKYLYEGCNQFSAEERRKYTGTTQLMLQLGYKIKIVKGHTSNFKITTDNDLDVAYRLLSERRTKNKIELLDCTLRDGGIVIDFNFGTEKMQDIKKCLENSFVEYVECGYINEKKGIASGKSRYDNETSIEKEFLKSGKVEGITYVAMIDYGTYDFSKLSERTKNGIDGIRLAFHKEHRNEAVEAGKIILEKGYQLFIQPMVSTRYTDEEFRELVRKCNGELSKASAFYIVDSFGQMDNVELLKKLDIVDEYLLETMKIGFHAHNNRQLAFSNAHAIIEHKLNHDVIIDSCIMGMGKGAGNLCTELIIPPLIAEGNSYNTVYIYDEIKKYFSNVIKTNTWGYCLDYYLSSLYGCTPSYVKLFTAHTCVTTDGLIKLLENMPEEKKYACDPEFAKTYLAAFLEENDYEDV